MATFEDLDAFLGKHVPAEMRQIRRELARGEWSDVRAQEERRALAQTIQGTTLQSGEECWRRLARALAVAVVFTPGGVTFCGRCWDDPDRGSLRLHS